jgi:arsenate reductase
VAADRFDVYSAGVEPTAVQPEAIDVMAELGMDIKSQRSKPVDEFEGQEFDYAITVCDSSTEGCPIFPGNARYVHWSFKDPAMVNGSDEQRIAAFREVRDQIQARVRVFVHEHSGGTRAAHV